MTTGSTHVRSGDPPRGGNPEPINGGGPPSVDAGIDGARADEKTVITGRTPDGPSPTRVRSGPTVELGQQLCGARLGHFELLEYVGGGGMGAVFRALDTQLNREVAVKVLSREQGADEEIRRRFCNEAQSAARLDHENIARVYFVGEDSGYHFIVFEFIKGMNLRDLVDQNGPLPLADAVRCLYQLSVALAHAHRREVVHRDIKPSNVIIMPEGRAKLVDMGLARLHQPDSGRDDLTASGVTLGTFDYISPEQARDPRYADARSDIYSLGCTTYFMLTGRPPFPDGTVLQKLLQHQGDEAPDVRHFNSDVPEELTTIVRRMMAKDPAQRYQDPAALVADTALFAERFGLTAATTGAVWIQSTLTPPPAWTRHLPWIVPLAALLIVVGLLRNGAPPASPEVGLLDAAQLASATPGEYRNTAPSDAAESDAGNDGAPSDSARHDAPVEGAESSTAAPPTAADDAPATDVAGSADATSPQSPDTSGGSITTVDPIAAALGAADISAGLSAADDDQAGDAPLRSEHADGPTDDPVAAAPTGGVYIVDASGANRRRHFTTFREAARDVRNNEVIVLDFDGRIEAGPLTLTNLNVTIRAGEGANPVVAFRPSRDLGWESSMISLSGGSLKVFDVALEFDVPVELSTANCSLFELRRVDSVQLEGCSLTIRNADALGAVYHPSAAFFHVKAGVDRELMALAPLAPRKEVNIKLTNLVARGEAALIRDDDQQPLSLDWSNGLLASSEQALLVRGGSNATQMADIVSMRLQHVTALLDGGLCKLVASDDEPQLPAVEITCENSVLYIGPSAAVVEQVVVGPVGMASNLAALGVTLKGDHIYCAGYDTFWRQSSVDSPNQSQRVSLDEWRRRGGAAQVVSKPDASLWQTLPRGDEAVHGLAVERFRLPDADVAAGTLVASDGAAAGLLWDRLPALPSEPDPPAIDARSNAPAHLP